MHTGIAHRDSSSHDALFSALRARLAMEVSSSAMLADLLQKLNGMQEAQGRTAEFKRRFDEFVIRAEDYSGAVRPFYPCLVRLLPSRRD